MSEHPIDDIFKKGLGGERPYEVDPQDWIAARRLLGLEDRRRRLFIWFGSVGSIAALVVIGLLTGLWSSESPLQSQITVETINNNSLDVPTLDAGEHVSVSTLPIATTDTKEAIPASTVSTITRPSPPQAPSPKESPGRQNISNRILENENSKQSSLDAESEVVITNSNEDESTLNAESFAVGEEMTELWNQPTTDKDFKKSIAQRSLLPLFFVPSLDINTFQIEFSSSSLSPGIVPVRFEAKDQERASIGLGLYTRFEPLDVTTGLGAFAEFELARHWFLNAGLGMNYRPEVTASDEGALETIDLSGNTVNLAAKEAVSSRLLDIEVPITLGHRFGRHSLLGGALFDYPIYSQTKISSDFASADPDLVDLPQGAPAPDPLEPFTTGTTVVFQERTLTNASELQQLNTYLTLGYGYDFSSRVSLRVQGSYLMSDIKHPTSEELQTQRFTADPDPAMTGVSRRWGIGLRLQYYLSH